MRSNNNRVSGGLPHSEIFGSKPIPGSPKLIAGYHVLHRLLLPRHPPNALIALDLIQKEQDVTRWFTGRLTQGLLSSLRSFRSKACTLIPSPCRDAECVWPSEEDRAVSVLDLEQLHGCRSCRRHLSHARVPHEADVSLYKRCQGDPKIARPNGRSKTRSRGLDDPFITVVQRGRKTSSGRRHLSTILRSSADVALVASASRMRRGGAYRDRTDDLLNANQALSQLS